MKDIVEESAPEAKLDLWTMLLKGTARGGASRAAQPREGLQAQCGDEFEARADLGIPAGGGVAPRGGACGRRPRPNMGASRREARKACARARTDRSAPDGWVEWVVGRFERKPNECGVQMSIFGAP